MERESGQGGGPEESTIRILDIAATTEPRSKTGRTSLASVNDMPIFQERRAVAGWIFCVCCVLCIELITLMQFDEL